MPKQSEYMAWEQLKATREEIRKENEITMLALHMNDTKQSTRRTEVEPLEDADKGYTGIFLLCAAIVVTTFVVFFY